MIFLAKVMYDLKKNENVIISETAMKQKLSNTKTRGAAAKYTMLK
jgi:hypothetical protein